MVIKLTLINFFKILIFSLLIFIIKASDNNLNYEKQQELKSDKDDIATRLYDLFSEESETQILDEKSINLATSFENFNDEVVKIFRSELGRNFLIFRSFLSKKNVFTKTTIFFSF